MSYERAKKLADKRARSAPARMTKEAGALSSSAASHYLAGGATLLALSNLPSALETAAAERDATERIQAAARTAPVERGNELIVPVDGLVERLTSAELNARLLALEPQPADDVSVVVQCGGALFWNILLAAGGPKALCAADFCVRALVRRMIDEARRQ